MAEAMRNARHFFPEQGVAPVAAPIGPDEVLFGKVTDVLLVQGGAGPGGVFLALAERCADRVQAGYEFALGAELFDDFGPDSGHDVHVADHVRAVRDLDPYLGDGGIDGAHREGYHIHGATPHAPLIETPHRRFEFPGCNPVVGRAGGVLVCRADIRPRFDPGYVARLGPKEETVRTSGKRYSHAAYHHLTHQTIILPSTPVAPVHGIRPAQLGCLGHPFVEFCVLTRHFRPSPLFLYMNTYTRLRHFSRMYPLRQGGHSLSPFFVQTVAGRDWVRKYRRLV
jgi:hypothetical protein